MADLMINVYQMLSANAAVAALVDDRIYMTQAPEDVDQPFIVWTMVSNVPYNTLACVPDSDQQRIQLDGYARDQEDARKLASAIMRALETKGNFVSGAIPMREPNTRLYRYTMDILLHHARGV